MRLLSKSALLGRLRGMRRRRVAVADWTERIKEYRQGDVINVESISLMTGRGDVEWVPTPLGAAVITQTCDLVLPDRPTAHLVPVVELSANEAKANRTGRRPHLVPLPELGDTFFADLTYIGTVGKSVVVSSTRRPGVTDIDDVRKFGQRVGRRFSRFAFPDEVVPWIRPLQSIVESRAGKGTSPLGWALERVASLRLECDGEWKEGPYSLTLCVVTEPGVLPPFPPDEIPGCPKSLHQWLYGSSGDSLLRKSSEIAQRLYGGGKASLDAVERYWLWSALADSWAAMCIAPPQAEVDVLSAVEGGYINSDIISSEDFPFERYRHSEEIDLDHLSSPLPI